MASAAEILAGVREGVVRVAHVGPPRPVTRIAWHGTATGRTPGALVMVTAARSHRRLVDLLRDLSTTEVAGAVVPGPVSRTVDDAVAGLGLTVAEVLDPADWAEVVAAGHLALRQDHARDAVDLHRRLFELTDRLAGILDAAVLVDDSLRRVVAHSTSVGRLDRARTQTILGREMPPEFVSRLRAAGALRRLTTSDRPFVVPAEPPDFLQRVVIPLRLGPESVGSVWAIRDDVPDAATAAALRAPLHDLALLLLRLRTEDGLSTRFSVEQVRAALLGASPGLGLPAGVTRVVALGPPSTTDALDDLWVWRTTLRRRSWAHPVLTEVDGTVFALTTDGVGAGSWSWLRTVGDRSGLGPLGAARPAYDVADLPSRRREAEEVVRAATVGGLATASYEEVWSQVVLDRTTRGLPVDANDDLAALVAADVRGDLAATLRVWLEQWGDHVATAARLRVHPNTVRLRMRRVVAALPTTDLTDPDHRLAVALILRASAGLPDGP